MSNESTDFARWIKAPRDGMDTARRAWPIEHYKPPHEHRIVKAMWKFAAFAGAFALGWLASRGV